MGDFLFDDGATSLKSRHDGKENGSLFLRSKV
jgi:hypothetical protein